MLVSPLVRRAVITILRRATTTETIAERLVGRLAQTAVVVLAPAYALNVLGVRIGHLLGALGIGGIATALALQETLENVQATVIDITSRAVTIRSNSGRTVFVPNSMVLDRELVDLVRHGIRRTTLVVGVACGRI